MVKHGVERDPGLQPERTLLSWQRSVLLFIIVVLLYLRDPFQPGGLDEGVGVDLLYRVAAAVLGAVVSGVVLAHVGARCWRARRREKRDGFPVPVVAPLARPWVLLVLSAGVAVLGAVIAAGAVLE